MGGKRLKQLEEFGVKIVNESVVVDGKIITSWCPSTAVEVALKPLKLLSSGEDVGKVREILGF